MNFPTPFTKNQMTEVIHLIFSSQQDMNDTLDPISNLREGVIKNRLGHNFPAECIRKKPLTGKLSIPISPTAKYVIAYVRGDTHTINHELQHAKFFLDAEFRSQSEKIWNDLPEKKRLYLEGFLKRLGYAPNVYVDEFQAYLYTEKNNFFGVRINDV